MGNCCTADGRAIAPNMPNQEENNMPVVAALPTVTKQASEVDSSLIEPKIWQPAPLPMPIDNNDNDFFHKLTPRERGKSTLAGLKDDAAAQPQSTLEALGRVSVPGDLKNKASKKDVTPAANEGESKRVERVRPWELLSFADRTDRFCVFMGTVMAAGQGSCQPLVALLLGDGFNIAYDPSYFGRVEEEMRPTAIKLFLIMCGQCFTATGWQGFLIFSSERQSGRMRRTYFNTVLTQDTTWFDGHDPAGLPGKLATEVQTIKDAIGQKYGLICMSLGQILCGFVVAFIKEWKVGVVCAAFLPAIAGFGFYLSYTIGSATRKQQQYFAKAGGAAEEILTAIRTVVAFGGEKRASDRFQDALGDALIGGIWGGINMGIAMGGMVGTMSLMGASVFLYSAYEVLPEPDADPGAVLGAFNAIYIGLSCLQNIGDPLLCWVKALASGAGMFAVLRNKPVIEIPENPNDPIPETLRSVDKVEYQKVWFYYPTRPDVMILKGVDLTIVQGDKVAFCGGSGSGKSTIIQLIERFYDPLSGVVLVNGVDLKDLPVRHYRRTIGYVGQEPILFATTVMENIKGGNLNITDEECIAAARQAEAFDFLDKLPQKFHTFVGIGGGAMSGGQKQRVAIARALVKKPQTLLLDEATSALDNESEKMVQNTIDGLQTNVKEGEHKLTTIAIAHRLSTIRNSNKIVCLQLGVIVEQGNHDELMALQGDYFGLVKAQEGNAPAPKPAAPKAAADKRTSVTKKRVSARMSGSKAPDKEGESKAKKAAKRVSALVQAAAAPLTTTALTEEQAEHMEEMETHEGPGPSARLIAMIDQKIYMALAFFSSLLAGGVMPTSGLISTHAVKSMYKEKDIMQTEITEWSALFYCCAAAAYLSEFGKYAIFAYVAETLTMKLRCECFKSLARREIGFFDDPDNAPSGLTAMLSTQCAQVSKMIAMSIGNIATACLSFSIGVVLAFMGSWRLTLAILALCPFVLVAMVTVVKMTTPNEGDDPFQTSYEIATESILNMRTIRALVSEAHSMQIFGETVQEVVDKTAKSSWKTGIAFGIGNSVVNLPQLMAFTYGGWLVDDGLEPQKMFQSLFCLLFGVLGAGAASAFAPGIVEGQLAAYCAFKVIDRKSKVDALEPTGTHENLGDGSFQLEHVMFFYPHRPELVILKDMNLTVEHGQSVAYCGPSGCGKSTIIQLAMRYYDPSAGIVRVGGTNLLDFNVCWWRKQVGLVGQEPILFDTSIYENVRYGKPHATSHEVDAMGKKADMGFILNGQKVWSDGVGPKGSRLSGGQKQRVAIARALIRNPSFLLLDEATSALDSASEHAVQQALDRAKKGRTTMSIAHRLSTIMDCYPIFICKGGYVIEKGSHEELIELGGVYHMLAKLAGAAH